MATFRTDLTQDAPFAKEGGTDLWVNIRTANKPVSIPHGLNRKPLRLWIVDADAAGVMFRTAVDNQRVVLTFTSAGNYVLRFE
jgi:hypothetical protein